MHIVSNVGRLVYTHDGLSGFMMNNNPPPDPGMSKKVSKEERRAVKEQRQKVKNFKDELFHKECQKCFLMENHEGHTEYVNFTLYWCPGYRRRPRLSLRR